MTYTFPTFKVITQNFTFIFAVKETFDGVTKMHSSFIQFNDILIELQMSIGKAGALFDMNLTQGLQQKSVYVSKISLSEKNERIKILNLMQNLIFKTYNKLEKVLRNMSLGCFWKKNRESRVYYDFTIYKYMKLFFSVANCQNK